MSTAAALVKHLLPACTPGRPFVVVDGGAGRGESVAWITNALRGPLLTNGAQVHCFEPRTEHHGAICAAVDPQFRGNLQVNFEALADKCEPREFHLGKNPWTASLRQPGLLRGSPEPLDRITLVQCITLDHWAKKIAKVERIHLLKMDLQGGEHDALLGAEDLLSHQQIDIIMLEVLFQPLYSTEHWTRTLGYLADLGYCLVDILGQRRGVENRLLWADAVYVSSRINRILDARAQEAYLQGRDLLP